MTQNHDPCFHDKLTCSACLRDGDLDYFVQEHETQFDAVITESDLPIKVVDDLISAVEATAALRDYPQEILINLELRAQILFPKTPEEVFQEPVDGHEYVQYDIEQDWEAPDLHELLEQDREEAQIQHDAGYPEDPDIRY